MAKTLAVIPSARRLIESLRDIGYELPSAVADLVDNSIDAHASEVRITVDFDGEDSWLRIADNGRGMAAARLNEAMRYGSERNYSDTELGKFGLGLKTASLSQCEQLTVATRANRDRRDIEIRRWDLEHVRNQDRWELLRLSTREAGAEVTEPLKHSTGTVVVWRRLDRVLRYRLPDGVAAEHGLAKLCREIEEHLGMVFHRFISGQARRVTPLAITLNGNPIDAWDPFARSEPSTQKLKGQTLSLRSEGRSHRIVVRPYILPNQMQFSTVRAWEAASGPDKWNRQQGFYIYRGDRMIQSGGWSRLRTVDEHTKLARVSVEIPRSADGAFEINVSKMRVTIPVTLRDDLKAIASAVAGRAQSAYRQQDGGGAQAGGRTSSRSRARKTAGGTESKAGAIGGSPNVGMVPWSLVETILRRELEKKHPGTLSRILASLKDAGAVPKGRVLE